MNATTTLDTNGYTIETDVFDPPAIAILRREMERLADGDALAGKRNLLKLSPIIEQISSGAEMRSILQPVLGDTFFPVRSIFFDKTPERNWPVLWHQDLTIAVEARADVEGFGPWSEKDGIPHVQPPESILACMITARIHLDAADHSNGALRVIPGSHAKGLLERSEIESLTSHDDAVTCVMNAGDMLLMKPLILHSSPRAKNPSHRRVVHIEYSNRELPPPLKWYETQ